jgi:N-acetylmuramate 1-kinase
VTPVDVPAEAAAALDRWLGGNAWSAEPIAGDASVRQYFRVRSADGSAHVLCFYPPEVRESLTRFLAAHEALCEVVHVPALIERCESAVLLEDVGSLSLAGLLERDPGAAAERYRDAAAVLDAFRAVGEEGRSVNPPFGREKFLDELDIARRHYVEDLAGRESGAVAEPFARLAEALTRHPYTLCHRDYHGHNIYLYKNNLYVIDYQDMRMGPDTYDLASLLRDRGVWRSLGPELERSLVSTLATAAGEAVEDVRHRYVETLLQRSIKALGTFARLVVVYGRRRYLPYVAPTLETIRECVRESGEWEDLAESFPFDYRIP